MKTRIILAEDNDLLAASIQEKLGLFDDTIEFKYRACHGEDLLNQLSSDHCADVILMDIEMPGLDGIQATEIVSQ